MEYHLEGRDNIYNHLTLSQIEFKPGMKFKARCPNISPKDGYCFGDQNYSDRSTICLAALHSGALEAEGGSFFVSIEEPLKNYPDSINNGIECGVQ